MNSKEELQFNFSDFVNEYQLFTRSTAQYPKDMPIIYTRLGFLGELGEIINKYKKVIRGDYELVLVREDLIAEISDICWYFCRYLDELDLRASWAFKNIYTDNDRTACFEEILEKINYTFSSIPYSQNYSLLQVVGTLLFDLCSMLNTNLEYVISFNQKKLQDRLERNVIKGDGDNR